MRELDDGKHSSNRAKKLQSMASRDSIAKLVNDSLVLTGQPDRTTDRTRKSLELAVLAACEFASPVVDSTHLLCGLIREGNGLAFHILNQLGLTRERLEQTTARGHKAGESSSLRLDDDLTAALNECWTLATSLNHNFIGTEHLLLGIVGARTRALELLQQLGVDRSAVNIEIRKLIGAPT